LIFAANQPVEQLEIKLPDLLSRLQWGLSYTFEDSDEPFKIKALQYRAQRRGLELGLDVAKYVVRHEGGQMESMFNVLQQLDSASLSAQRKLTRPFVKSVMAW